MWGFVLYKTGKNIKVLSIKLYKLCRVAGQLVNTLKPCKMYEIYKYIGVPPVALCPLLTQLYKLVKLCKPFGISL